LKSVNSPEVQLRHTLFLFSFRSVTGGLRRPSPLAYAEGQAAVFAVNAALMTCQWQRCAWTVPCTPHWCRTRGWTSRKYRFPSFAITRLVVQPSLTGFVLHTQPTADLGREEW